MSMTYYTARELIPKMTILTWLDKLFDRLFDALPLRRVMGLSAVLVGTMNIVDTHSGTANVLIHAYGLPDALVIAYMSIVAASGVGLLIQREKPSPAWYIPLLSYFSINPIAYLTGAALGTNSLTFGFKALGSVGLLWWLLIHTLRRDTE